MERNALQKLLDWNNNKRKKPLIVWGARQVGKTYLIKDIFADTYYKVITYDFDRQEPLSMVAEPKTPYGEKS